ncbi:MAG TPA: ABC transporter ATP-binding protein [Gaiellaceae bacterium]|nr:ABC transporter ATP-binding protein [Gaiellaceae bacterium]HUJ56445.1 ABC transporter ATP-binding protein [Gaiellaceae bacterium]
MTVPAIGTGVAGAAPVLEIEDLSITYRSTGGDVDAVRNIDLSLARGEVVGLAGESGSGKSTLALGAIRLLRPPAVITSGRVTYRGRRVGGAGLEVLDRAPRELRALRWREIAIVFQSAMNALNPVLRVDDQLGDVIDAHMPLPRDARQERLEELLDLVGIPRERLRSYPHELSGGMRQRVMIAMALAVDPEIVIMDEPTTALDVVVQREILEQIAALRRRLGFAMLFITHDLSLLLEIADRIMIMYAGQLIELGNAEDIRVRAAHPYTHGLLGSFPSVHGPRRTLAGIAGSPPDMRSLPPGCPFAPRCSFATDSCAQVDMRPRVVPGSHGHLTACPFVTADVLAGPGAVQTCGEAGA